MHTGMNTKGIYERTMKEINTNERNMKGNECKMKGICTHMKETLRNMHANERKMKGTASETNKTTPRCISEPV